MIRRRRVAGTRELPAASLQQGRIGRRCFWSRLGQLIKTCGCVAGRPGRTRLFHEGRRQTPEPVLDVCEQRRVGYVLRLHGCDERHLLLEKLCDVAVQGSRRVEVFTRDPLVLTETIATVLRLSMIGRDPVEVLENDMRACRQGDADATGDDVAQRHPYRWICLEPVHGFHPLLRRVRAGDGDGLVAQLLLVALDAVGEAGEDNDLLAQRDHIFNSFRHGGELGPVQRRPDLR